MIDTDKYEGHTPAPWKWNTDDVLVGGYLPLVAFDNDGQQNQRTLNLIADAPLLLAEVKRLRKTNEFHMMLDREETKERLKLQKENDNLTKLCIERYAEVKRLQLVEMSVQDFLDEKIDSLEFCRNMRDMGVIE